MNDFLNSLDKDLIVMILIIIAAVVILKLIFRFLSGFKWLKILITVGCVVGIVFMIVQYVDENSDIYSNNPSYYIYGKVEFASKSMNKLDVTSVRSNFIKGGTGRITVKVSGNVPIYDAEHDNQKIKLDDVKYDDTVQVWCKENQMPEKGELTAVKIVKRSSK